MRRLHADRGENNAPGMGSEPLQAAALRVDSSARNTQSRTICKVTPPIFAASVRLAPS
jgi:hypothetical protein